MHKIEESVHANSPTNSPSKRNAALDVLRGIAVILVIFSHVELMSKDSVKDSFFKYIRLLFSGLTVGGWSGVDLFFVLSGFLVSGLIFNEYRKTQGFRAGRFLIRRGFKIYPNLFFFILITWFVESLEGNMFGLTPPITAYLKDLFFLHNYFGGRWEHTWSLDVEEAFYFLLTGLFILYIRLNKLTINALTNTYLTLLVAGITMRLVTNHVYPNFTYKHTFIYYHYTHFRLDSLFFGVLLSYFYNFRKEQLLGFFSKYKTTIYIVSIWFILLNFMFPRRYYQWVSIVLLATNPIAFGSIIILALDSKLKLFNNKILSSIGRNSYAIYLWHPFMNIFVNYYINTSKIGFLIYLVVYVALGIGVGYLATKIIEEPFLKMRDKYYPSLNKTSIVPLTNN